MDHVRVTLDVYNKNNRNVEVKLPKWITFWYESRILKLTARDVLFYNLSIAELDSPWQAYEVSASTLKCSNKNENVSKVHFGLMKLTNSWALDQSYSLIGQLESNLSNRYVRCLCHQCKNLYEFQYNYYLIYLLLASWQSYLLQKRVKFQIQEQKSICI